MTYGFGSFAGGLSQGMLAAWRDSREDAALKAEQSTRDLQNQMLQNQLDKQDAEDEQAKNEAANLQKLQDEQNNPKNQNPYGVGDVNVSNNADAQQLARMNSAANVRSLDNAQVPDPWSDSASDTTAGSQAPSQAATATPASVAAPAKVAATAAPTTAPTPAATQSQAQGSSSDDNEEGKSEGSEGDDPAATPAAASASAAAGLRPTTVSVYKPYTEEDMLRDNAKSALNLGLSDRGMKLLAQAKAQNYEKQFGVALLNGDVTGVLSLANGVMPNGQKIVRIPQDNKTVVYQKVDANGNPVGGALPWRSDQEMLASMAALYHQDKLADVLTNLQRTNDAADKSMGDQLYRMTELGARMDQAERALAAKRGTPGTPGAQGTFGPLTSDFSKFQEWWPKDTTGSQEGFQLARNILLNNPQLQNKPDGDSFSALMAERVMHHRTKVNVGIGDDGRWQLTAGDNGGLISLGSSNSPYGLTAPGGEMFFDPKKEDTQARIVSAQKNWIDTHIAPNPALLGALQKIAALPPDQQQAQMSVALNKIDGQTKEEREMRQRQAVNALAFLKNINAHNKQTKPAVPAWGNPSNDMAGFGIRADALPVGMR